MSRLLWTFKWDTDEISFELPEPAESFTSGARADLPIMGCMGYLQFSIDEDGVSVQCMNLSIQDKETAFVLSQNQAYNALSSDGKPVFSFLCEALPDNAQSFDRTIELNDRPCICGSAESCHIQIPLPGRPCDAFRIERHGTQHAVWAEDAILGVYINTRRLRNGENALLREGDFIFVSGASFAYTGGRLLTSSRVKVFDLAYTDTAEQNSHLAYPLINRTSRFHEKLPTEPIDLLDPPAAAQDQQRNLVVSFLPVLGMAALTLLMRSNLSGNSMMLFSVGSMSLGSIASVFTYLETKKRNKAKNEERGRLYSQYIEEKRKEIKALREKESEILRRIYIAPETEIKNIMDFTAELFDRTASDDDFLDIRIGTGRLRSGRQLRCRTHEVFEKTDELYELPGRLVCDEANLDDVPVVIKGTRANAIGVQGSFETIGRFMNQIVLDIVSRQYPADVQLYALCGIEFEPQMYAWRMLPHLQSPELGRRNIVHDSESRDLILEKLFKEFTLREESKEYATAAPWLVLTVYTDPDIMSHPLMRYIPQASKLHVLFIFLAQHREQLPMGCSHTVRLFTNVHSGLLVNMYDRESDCVFDYSGVDNDVMEAAARKLAPVYSGSTNLASTLTSSISFLDMPGIDNDLSPETICENWKHADPRKSLAAPIGVAVGDKPVELDLTEKIHGPHGLVAGTTGSGKSEMLITYMLALAYRFSPEDVNFVIIDFKGGGTASQFKDLPHLIGTITNLSDGEINRSLISIRAEHRRRQRMFNEIGVSNINKYMSEYRAGRAKKPLPHLFIIADEFAELKTQQPDFMAELISTSRIGRSLGIHLILATQKPTGVVNEQIWSNSDFKLCLRVQTREDSNEMLRSPLAAEIREAGRGYLQVTRAGVFQLFQSGYSGVKMPEGDKIVKKYRLDKRSLSGRRTCLFEQKPGTDDGTRKPKTQFDATLEAIICANAIMGYAKPDQLCLPALAETISFAQAEISNEIPLGIYDRPSQQIQDVLSYDPATDNLLIVGASQMGKTNLLQVILRQYAEHMDANQACLYIMDFNTGVFKTMQRLSIVGGVVTQDQEERFKNLLKLLRQEITERKSKLAENDMTSFKAYRDSGKCTLPQIVVFIDNYAAYKELYDEEYGAEMAYLFREGPSAGISFAVTATRGNLVGTRNMSSFSRRILLHIADVNNMGEVIDGCRRKIPEIPGRGFAIVDKEMLEIQIYHAFDDGENIEAFVNAHSTAKKARGIPEVPTILTHELLELMFGRTGGPYEFAYAMDFAAVEPLYIRLDRQFELALAGKNEEGQRLFLEGLLGKLTGSELSICTHVRLIDHYDKPLEMWKNRVSYSTDVSALKDIIKELYSLAKQRADQVAVNGSSALDDEPLEVLIVNTKEGVNVISADATTVKLIEEMRDRYRQMKLLFVFANLDNKPVNFSAPALLRQIREARQGILFEPLSTGRMYDVDGLTVRDNKYVLAKNDAFRLDDGFIYHIRLVTPEKREEPLERETI